MIEPGEKPQRFDYTPRHIRATGGGYSRFVAVLKFSLPLVALVIIGILVARLSGSSAPKQQDIAALPPAEKTTPGQIELVGAKYEGTDEQNRPYTVTADKAVRAVSAPDAVSFVNPVADITLSDNSWVAVKGAGGTLDHAKETMTLEGGVSVFHDSGYEMRVKTLFIDLKKKTAFTQDAVTAQGPMGTIAAQNMSVEDQGDLIIFGGPATMTIFRLAAGKQPG